MRCRVVLGRDDVIATLVPTIWLTSVDLPTLGRPTTATKPERTLRRQFPLRAASLSPVGVAVGRAVGRRVGRRLDAHPLDAPAPHVDRGQAEAVHLDRVARVGHPPDEVEHETADGVPRPVRAARPRAARRRRPPSRPALTSTDPSARRSTVGLLHVELVDDVAHQLFEQVLERDQPGRPAVLVDHDGHVELLLLHLAQEVRDVLGLGDELGRPRADSRTACSALPTRSARTRSLV